MLVPVPFDSDIDILSCSDFDEHETLTFYEYMRLTISIPSFKQVYIYKSPPV